ncbi:hypothetical protein HDU67_004711 [Dinochytrium kinnereticum]|nr:hypothetical protein HDU67_004711 [Dinochytrium kinnereticum]
MPTCKHFSPDLESFSTITGQPLSLQDAAAHPSSEPTFTELLEIPMHQIVRCCKNKVEAKLLFDVALCARKMDGWLDAMMRLAGLEEMLDQKRKTLISLCRKDPRPSIDLVMPLPLIDVALQRVRAQRKCAQEAVEQSIQEILFHRRTCLNLSEMNKADEAQLVSLGHFSLAVDKRVMYEIHQTLASKIHYHLQSPISPSSPPPSWSTFLPNIHDQCRSLMQNVPSQGDFDLATPSCLNPRAASIDLSSEVRLPHPQKRKRTPTRVSRAGSPTTEEEEDDDPFFLNARARQRQRLLDPVVEDPVETALEFPSIPIMDSGYLVGIGSASHVSETPDHSHKPIPAITPSPMDDRPVIRSPSEFHESDPLITSTQLNQAPHEPNPTSPIFSSTKATQSSDESRTTAGGDDVDILQAQNEGHSSPFTRGPLPPHPNPPTQSDRHLLDSLSLDKDWMSGNDPTFSASSKRVSRGSAPISPRQGEMPSALTASTSLFGVSGNKENRATVLNGIARSRSWTHTLRPHALGSSSVLEESLGLTNSPPKEGSGSSGGKLGRLNTSAT